MNREARTLAIDRHLREISKPLTEEQRADVRRRWLAGADAGDLAREFQITVKLVRKIALARAGQVSSAPKEQPVETDA
jgi:DNA-directed RNA polymerase specialized sigma24 family protein